MNAAAVLLIGYATSELIGLSIEVLVPEVSQQEHERLRREYFLSPNLRLMGAGRRLSALTFVQIAAFLVWRIRIASRSSLASAPLLKTVFKDVMPSLDGYRA